MPKPTDPDVSGGAPPVSPPSLLPHSPPALLCPPSAASLLGLFLVKDRKRTKRSHHPVLWMSIPGKITGQHVYIFTMWFCFLSFLSLLVPAPNLPPRLQTVFHLRSLFPPSEQTLCLIPYLPTQNL